MLFLNAFIRFTCAQFEQHVIQRDEYYLNNFKTCFMLYLFVVCRSLPLRCRRSWLRVQHRVETRLLQPARYSGAHLTLICCTTGGGFRWWKEGGCVFLQHFNPKLIRLTPPPSRWKSTTRHWWRCCVQSWVSSPKPCWTLSCVWPTLSPGWVCKSSTQSNMFKIS